MIDPDVAIVDLAPREWSRFSRLWVSEPAREIQVLHRGGVVRRVKAPDDVTVRASAIDDVEAWCASTQRSTGVDRVRVIDLDRLGALARDTLAEAQATSSQTDLIMAAHGLVDRGEAIVSVPEPVPHPALGLLDELVRHDGWVFVVCCGTETGAAVEWTLLLEVRAHRVVTITTADHVTPLRPPEISVDALLAAVGEDRPDLRCFVIDVSDLAAPPADWPGLVTLRERTP